VSKSVNQTAPVDAVTAAEAAVIRVLLNDAEALADLAEVLPEARVFGHAEYRAVYGAILALAKQQTPPAPLAVAEALGWALKRVQALATGWNVAEATQVMYLAEMVAKEGHRRLLKEALDEARQLANEPTDDIEGMGYVMMQMVAHATESAAATQESSLESIDVEFEQKVAYGQQHGGVIGIPTRLFWLNDLTAGMQPSKLWVLTGPPKFGRKTTLAMNLVIDACRYGAAVDFFALEGSRLSTYARLLAMLATDLLRKWQLPDECILSGQFIMQGLRTEAQANAIAQARAELLKFPLKIYDGRDRIRMADDIETKLRRDVLMRDVKLVVIDYLQLVGRGELFKRLEESTHRVQEMTSEHGTCTIALCQQNQVRIREYAADGGKVKLSYTTDIKGGGDPDAAADVSLITLLDPHNDGLLHINLALSRDSAMGIAEDARINASSGWIL